MISKIRSEQLVSYASESERGGCLFGEPARRRSVLLSSVPPRRSAVRRRTSTRSRYVRIFDSTGSRYFCWSFSLKINLKIKVSSSLIKWQSVESFTRTYHGRVKTERHTAGRRGEAETGRTGRQRPGSPRRQPSILFSRRSKKALLGAFQEVRTRETLCKSVEKQKPRLTIDLSEVDTQFFRGTKCALRSWPRPVYRCLFIFANLFYTRHVREHLFVMRRVLF